ncbi:MAG: GH3 auxin-responsive promoter family protein, partial [Chloroflexota bacterium]|nr:GH3 auxin-responsive promoter family protein [Chloroflexota bacterium]
MTPMPHVGLLEFIPEDEWAKSQQDPSYMPSTVLLDGVSPGKRYELIFSSFNGGVMVRYRPGDMVRFVAMEDKEADVWLPQLVFWSRADKLIDIGGFTRLDEKTLWLGLEDAQVPYKGWIARKETVDSRSLLHVYIATDAGSDTRDEVESRLHDSLKKYDVSYADLEIQLGMKPLILTFLPPDTLAKYDLERQLAGSPALTRAT